MTLDWQLPDLLTVDFALYAKPALGTSAARLCEITVELVQAPPQPVFPATVSLRKP